MGLLWTCVCSFFLSRQPSAYVARKYRVSPTHLATRNPRTARSVTRRDPKSPLLLATRNLCTVINMVHSNLVLTTVPESLYQETLRPCNKHGGVCTTHNSCDCRRFKKDETDKADFRAAKKGRKKPNPTKQSFAQLSEKLDKLEKVLKKRDTKKRKCCHSDSDSDSE